ncbi:hypothetical protein [Aquibacillus kalidii]|uniref:hypothetical protein n=1 Tax=Aquibacillus kalidii TaxID=2762597 RepID=UPI0016477880|nr:hypothetical protein [Aquibacillus kalidii]
MNLTGQVINGEFDSERNEFTLQQIKHFDTQSTLNERQLDSLHKYLTNHTTDPDGQVLTLYDQLPVRLSQTEIKDLIHDLEKIKSMYQ